MTSDRIASSLARPPAFRMTCASPSASPAYFAGSSRASMQVRMANPRAGGSASSPLSPNDAAYSALARRTSARTDMGHLLSFPRNDLQQGLSAKAMGLVTFIHEVEVVKLFRKHQVGRSCPVLSENSNLA